MVLIMVLTVSFLSDSFLTKSVVVTWKPARKVDIESLGKIMTNIRKWCAELREKHSLTFKLSLK